MIHWYTLIFIIVSIILLRIVFLDFIDQSAGWFGSGKYSLGLEGLVFLLLWIIFFLIWGGFFWW